MTASNPSTVIERAEEVRHLASAIFAESFGMDWTTALHEADRQVDGLLSFAADWDAHAAPALPAPAPLYVPSALDLHEQRATDKALYMRAAGVVARQVGRHYFVPSRTTGGTIYRVTLDSCSCEAFARGGRLCWHRALIGLERELAA